MVSFSTRYTRFLLSWWTAYTRFQGQTVPSFVIHWWTIIYHWRYFFSRQFTQEDWYFLKPKRRINNKTIEYVSRLYQEAQTINMCHYQNHFDFPCRRDWSMILTLPSCVIRSMSKLLQDDLFQVIISRTFFLTRGHNVFIYSPVFFGYIGKTHTTCIYIHTHTDIYIYTYRWTDMHTRESIPIYSKILVNEYSSLAAIPCRYTRYYSLFSQKRYVVRYEY